MKRNKDSKYSDHYYRKIFLRSAICIMLLTSTLLVFFTMQTIHGNIKQAESNLQTENTENVTLLNETIENVKRITMFFAQYKELSPVFQMEADLNLRTAMLLEEAKTFISCFDYLAAIEITTPDDTVKYGLIPDMDYEEVAFSDPFMLYTTPSNVYPPLLCLEYTTSDIDIFSTKITLYSKYLSKNYMSENTYLLTPEGNILLSKDHSLIGKTISDVTGVKFEDIRNNNILSSHFIIQQNFSGYDMILVSVLPKSTIYADTIFQVLTLFLIYCAITSIGIMILYLYLRNLYNPIKDVAQILKYYMPDNDSLLENDAAFIKMCAKDELTTEDIDAALLQIKKSQLHTLHSQISPHLLGNTLESIKWEIVKEYGYHTNIEKALATLSLFLNESYQYHRMITNIRSEIARTRQYSDMMVFCFYRELVIEWDVAEELMDCSIISLTLQPFIENSIKHGFSKSEANPRIKVKMYSEGQKIHILITDNGRGMDENVLESIRKSLSDSKQSNRHIGIKNSHLKLKLLFGSQYGVTHIESNENGTTIHILIPKYKAPADNV